MRAGVIDIGSNSIKLMIGELVEDQVNVLESLRNVLPLGKSTFLKGRISQDNINQTVNILRNYQKILKEYEVGEVSVIATTAVREAGNRNIFIDTISRKTGLTIEVLNAGDVIYYIDSFLSHRLEKAYPIHEKNVLIAELGAGSLDISVLRKGFMLMNIGLSIGTLRLKQLLNQLDGTVEECMEAVQEYVENEFSFLAKTIPRVQLDDIILIDENYFYLQNVLPNKKIESSFFQLTKKESEKIQVELSGKNVSQKARTYKIPLDFAETISSYAHILNMFYSLTSKDEIYILETSLSEAILCNKLLSLELSPKYHKSRQLETVAVNLCHKFSLDISHAKQVAWLSQKMFENLKDYLGLEDGQLLYLKLAAYLHDIGKIIHNRSHHKHSEYVINALNLFRLTDDEIKIIACIARYHRKGLPSKNHLLYNSLSTAEQILVQKLAAILRVANALDRSHRQKVKDMEFKFSRAKDLTLAISGAGNFLLERADFAEKKQLFEEITGNRINLMVKTG